VEQIGKKKFVKTTFLIFLQNPATTMFVQQYHWVIFFFALFLQMPRSDGFMQVNGGLRRRDRKVFTIFKKNIVTFTDKLRKITKSSIGIICFHTQI
jgi:hypothetical protein